MQYNFILVNTYYAVIYAVCIRVCVRTYDITRIRVALSFYPTISYACYYIIL